MSSDDFLLTAAELQVRHEKRRRLFIAGLALLFLLVIALVLGRPSAHAIKAWQARRHAEKAFHFIADEKWNDAQKEATAAYQLSPNEPEAIRAVARFLSRLRQPQALEFWDRLAKQQPLTHDDLRDEAAVALALGESERAAAAINPLLAGNGHEATPSDWLLAAQLSAERGAPNESMAALQHIFNDRKSTPNEQLAAAVMELRVAQSGSEPEQKNQVNTWQRIEKLSHDKTAVGLDALVLLAQRALTLKADSRDAQAAALADALDSQPLAKTSHKLLAADLRMAAAPNEKQKLIQVEIDRWKAAGNDDLAVLAKWLNGHGEFDRELEIIPLDRALQTRELFLQHVDALGALGRWEEIRRLLEAERFPLDPTIEHMYLARCYAQLGEKTASDNNWRRALEDAVGDARKLMTLADYAEKNGAVAIAASACDGAIVAAPKLRIAWQAKLRLARATRETKAIHSILAEMLKIWPNDTAIQNDEAYSALLHLPNDEPANPELNAIEARATELVRREPASLPHRTLLALARLKQGRPPAALAVYSGIQIAPNALTPSNLAVHAAVLAANGQFFEAKNEFARIAFATLLPEEQSGTAGLR